MSIKFESGLDWANPFYACDRHKVIGKRRRDSDVMKLPMFLFPFIPSRVYSFGGTLQYIGKILNYNTPCSSMERNMESIKGNEVCFNDTKEFSLKFV